MVAEPLESSIYKNRIVNSRIALRCDDISHWMSSDVQLYPGEPAVSFETDLSGRQVCKLKIGRIGPGNQLSTWSQLPYLNISLSDIVGSDILSAVYHYKFHQEGNNLSLMQSSDDNNWTYSGSSFQLSDLELSVQSILSCKTRYDSLSSYSEIRDQLSSDGYALTSSIKDGTLTITQNGSNPQTFSANSSSDVSIDISAATSIEWGQISGSLSDQTDLNSILETLNSDISSKVLMGNYEDQQYYLSPSDLSVVKIKNEDYYKLIASGTQNPDILYVLSSNQLNAYGQQILNVAEPSSATDAATKNYVDVSIADLELSNYYKKSETSSSVEISSALNKNTISHFKTLSMIKPYSEHRMFCQMTASMSSNFSNPLSVDSSISNALFSRFTANGISSAWTIQPVDGFAANSNNQPILFNLESFLSANSLHLTDQDLLYVKYRWYSVDSDNDRHFSDEYSVVLPTNTEVGANSRDVASKREFNALRQEVLPQRQYISEMSGYFDFDSKVIGIVQTPLSGNPKFCLRDFASNKTYVMSFTTTPTFDAIDFYYDLGNGPEQYQTLSGNNFSSDSNYEVNIFNDRIRVIAANGLSQYESSMSNQFKTLSLIKPYSTNKLFVNLVISQNIDFTDPIQIDSSIRNTLFKGWMTNDSISQWVVQEHDGFSTAFNNSPIVVDIEKILIENQLIPNDTTTIYIKYYWYWVDSNNDVHRSDDHSAVLPTNTEVGANAADVTSKREFSDLKREVIPTAKTIGHDIKYPLYYGLKSNEFNKISSLIEDKDKIILYDYDVSKSYKMSFTTISSTDISVGLKFYVDYGNGPEYDDTLSINVNSFMPDTEYVTEIRNDCIMIQRIGKQDVVNYLKENSNSVTLRIWNN